MSQRTEHCGSFKLRMQNRVKGEWRRLKVNRSGSKLLLFSQDPERTEYAARQNNCSRLITQLVAAQQDLPLREFTSYFKGTAKNNPPLLLTSHSRSRRRSVVPLYPSLLQQTLKWDPFVTTASSSQVFVPEITDQEYNCRCEDCTNKRCPDRMSSADALKYNLFKDNIITFCDQCTMTPKVNDVACGVCLGVTPIMETRNVDISAALSDIAVKDSNSINNENSSNTPRSPSILKKNCVEIKQMDCTRCERIKAGCEQGRTDYCRPYRDYNDGYIESDRPRMQCDIGRPNCDSLPPPCENKWRPMRSCEIRHEAVRDTDTSECCYEPLLSSKSNRSFCKQDLRHCNDPERHDHVKPNNENRRMLYNEGITDSAIYQFPNCATKKPSPPPVKAASKVSVGRSYPEVETFIPYSHHGASRYHDDCKKTENVHYYAAGPDEMKYTECPRHASRTYCRKNISPACRPVAVHMPKKMLTSEKDVDAFIINGKKYYRADD